MTYKIYSLDVSPYPCSIEVFIGPRKDWEKFCLKNKYGVCRDYAAITLMLEHGNNIIWLPNCNYRSIVHELYHTITNIFQSIGIDNNEIPNEAGAYLMDCLFSQVVYLFKKRSKKK
jgi:hypothetical protein